MWSKVNKKNSNFKGGGKIFFKLLRTKEKRELLTKAMNKLSSTSNPSPKTSRDNTGNAIKLVHTGI